MPNPTPPLSVSGLTRDEFYEVVQRLVDGAALSVAMGERMLATFAAVDGQRREGK